jgi:hypothetical protein
MNYFRGDKVVLIKECDALKTVGEVYEVANITDTQVVVRNAKTKVAVGAVDIAVFDQYFKKPEEVKGWTQWKKLIDESGNVIAFYRTNFKKVQVRIFEGECSEATCNKRYGDEFNLYFGVQLAYRRCLDKAFEKLITKYETSLNEFNSMRIENKNMIKKMLRSLDKTETEDKGIE